VLLGERLGSQVADHVAIDNRAAARELTAHLLDGGRRRVAVIGAQPPPYGHSARLRLQGYRDALKEAGIAEDPQLVVTASEWGREPGRLLATELMNLPEPPDALFCFNDLLALGAIRALHDLAIRMPEDVAVAGFDDVEAGRFSVPSLTTVAPDLDALALEAVDRLARRLDASGLWQPEEVTVGYRLVIRESTVRAPSTVASPLHR
jgi:DNA-binding LacI/PurR family transcriptional regulator